MMSKLKLDEIKLNVMKKYQSFFVAGFLSISISFLLMLGMKNLNYSLYFLLLGFGILITTFLYMITEMMVMD